MFIAFDGLDGTGKTTQVRLLADALARRGIRVATYDFASHPDTSDLLKWIKGNTVEPRVRELVYYAEGLLTSNDIARRARGQCAIIDRFYLTYFAYGPLNGWPPDQVRTLTRGMLEPDLYFYLDIEPEVAASRIKARGGFVPAEINYDFEATGTERAVQLFIDYQRSARDNYRAARTDAHITIDASRPESVIHSEVLEYVQRALGK